MRRVRHQNVRNVRKEMTDPQTDVRMERIIVRIEKIVIVEKVVTEEKAVIIGTDRDSRKETVRRAIVRSVSVQSVTEETAAMEETAVMEETGTRDGNQEKDQTDEAVTEGIIPVFRHLRLRDRSLSAAKEKEKMNIRKKIIAMGTMKTA